jgi:hypothetical protein
LRRIGANREQAELLLSLVRVVEDTPFVPRIEDWEAASDIVRRHGLLPQLFQRFAEWESAMPENRARSIREEGYQNTARNGVLASEAVKIIAAFDCAGIPALPFKGVALAAQLYGNLAHRPAGDIDILIKLGDRHRAAEIVEDAGYVLVPGDPGDIELQFRRESDGLTIELCWSLSPSWFRREFGMDALWRRRCVSMLLGTEIPGLSPEHTLIVLSVHGIKHEWARLFWVRDIVQLLSLHPEIDWRLVEREARRFGVWGCVALGVLLSWRLGGISVEEVALRRFDADTRVRRLARHIEKHLFDGNYSQLDGWPYQYWVLGFRDRMRLVLKAGLAAPNARDRDLIPLPRALASLYSLVRPLRLVRDYFRARP